MTKGGSVMMKLSDLSFTYYLGGNGALHFRLVHGRSVQGKKNLVLLLRNMKR